MYRGHKVNFSNKAFAPLTRCQIPPLVRPPLNKKLFHVHRLGGLKRADWDFFFMIFEKKSCFPLNLLGTF